MIEEVVEIAISIIVIILVVTIGTTEIIEITEIAEITIEIIEIVITGIKGEFVYISKLFISYVVVVFRRGDRNRQDNFNRGSGGNRNDITRSRDDKEKPTRRDKSTGDPKDIDRMPKYQAPVKPVSIVDYVKPVTDRLIPK